MRPRKLINHIHRSQCHGFSLNICNQVNCLIFYLSFCADIHRKYCVLYCLSMSSILTNAGRFPTISELHVKNFNEEFGIQRGHDRDTSKNCRYGYDGLQHEMLKG